MYRLSFEEFTALQKRNVMDKQVPKIKNMDNKYKREIDFIFMALGLDVVKEYRFHEKRKWRFDWALPAIKVCVEYEGLNFRGGGASGHQTIKGVAAGNEKYSEASIAGWCLVLVNAISVDSGLAHDLIKRAVSGRRMTFAEIGKRNRLVGEPL